MKKFSISRTLLPSHSGFPPIEKTIREKYGLPKLSPDKDRIAEIFLGDEIVPLEEFRKDIEECVRGNLAFIPLDLLELHLSAKIFSKTQYKKQYQAELKSFSKIKKAI